MTENMTQNNFGWVENSFKIVPLKDYIFFQEGPGLRKWQWTDSGMKVLNVTNLIGDGTIDINNTSRYISLQEFQKTYSHFAIENGDIIVASSGNTYGKVGRIAKQHLPLMMNTSVIRFHPIDKNIVHPDFLYGFLRSPLFKNQVEQFVIGSAQPNFGPTHLKQMKFVLPPYPVQIKISLILSTYDSLIDNNTRRIQILEEIAHRIYTEWFVHYRFPGHKKVKMVDSKLGRIPVGWRLLPSTEPIQYKPNLKVPKGDLKPFVLMAGLSETSMQITQTETRSGNSGSKFQNGDTLFARITPCLENGKTGFVNFLPTDDDVALGSTEFIVMRSRTLCPEYVYCLARSNDFRENAIKSMAGASGRQRVRNECFKDFLIAQPDQVTLRKFQKVVAPMFSVIEVYSRKNANLRQARDILLPKLISGEIDVSDMPLPEEIAA